MLSLSILLKKANLFDLSLDEDKCVVDMIVEVEGVKLVNWRWRRKLFQWEEETVDVCSGLVLGVARVEGEEDCLEVGR